MTNTARYDDRTLADLAPLVVAVQRLRESGDGRLYDAAITCEGALQDALRAVLGSPSKAAEVVRLLRSGDPDLEAAVELVVE